MERSMRKIAECADRGTNEACRLNAAFVKNSSSAPSPERASDLPWTEAGGARVTLRPVFQATPASSVPLHPEENP